MSIILNIILFVLILGVIVFIHEFGHFIFAKLNGVYVYEFAIGMGPKLLSKKGKETEYTLRAIPIGGFCQLAGEEVDEDEMKKVPKNRRLQDKKPWQRFLIMFFGAGNNFLSAIIIIFFISLIWGGTSMTPKISSMEKNYPAEKVGLEKNDIILKINDHKTTTMDDVSLYLTVANHDKNTKIQVKKQDGTIKNYNVKPKKVTKEKNTTYVYGIGLRQEKTYGLTNAFKYTYKKTASIFKQMFVTVGYLFTGGIKISQLSGPVGIYSVVGEQSKAGLSSILYLIAFLSINVGFINLLPLPAFDGGHILFIIIEKIKGSPVDPKTENIIHTIGLMLLMLLMIYITINDVLKLF